MKSNHSLIRRAALFSFAALNIQLTAAPMGTAFTYQGRLVSGVGVANGAYEIGRAHV